MLFRSIDTMVYVLAKWLTVACWVYRTRAPQLRENTSKNPTFNGRSLYLNPAKLTQLVPEVGTSMRIVDELGGVLYPSTVGESIDAVYEAEEAFVCLEEVMRRMAVIASTTGPVAATFTANGSTHAISVSLRAGVTREDLVEPVEASTPVEAIQLLDLIWEGCLNIDFVDSHRNFVATERAGKGIWMSFSRLTDLCTYIRDRHPRITVRSDVAPSIYTKRPNAFDVCLWQDIEGMAPEDSPLFGLAVKLNTNVNYKAWRKRLHKKRKMHEAGADERIAQVSTPRQRIEKSIQRLCNSNPADS